MNDKKDLEQVVHVHNHIKAPKWSPGIAGLLSFIIPGAGQMYKGKVLRGLLWLFFTTLGYFLLILPGLVLHVICIATAASGNPYEE